MPLFTKSSGDKMDIIDKIRRRDKIKYTAFYIILGILLVCGILSSVCMGAMDIEVKSILYVIANKIFGCGFEVADNITAIVWNIRLPRIICACAVGAALAVSGAVFQGILQNPLADPYTIGISTGASFGAALALIINIIAGIYFPVTVAALIGAFATLVAVIHIADRGTALESSNLIIAGIIVSAVLSSGVSFIKMLAGENVGVIVFWIMGSLSAVSWDGVITVLPAAAVCIVIASLLAGQLDIMSLGDDYALSLGVNTKRLRLIYLVLGSVMAAVSVSVCGVIGFVGLVVPHLLRRWTGAKNMRLIPLSALFGAVLLLYADSAARILSSGEIPVGVLTTLIGGPFFIFVFTKREDRGNV